LNTDDPRLVEPSVLRMEFAVQVRIVQQVDSGIAAWLKREIAAVRQIGPFDKFAAVGEDFG
jgi:hypothetical protein